MDRLKNVTGTLVSSVIRRPYLRADEFGSMQPFAEYSPVGFSGSDEYALKATADLAGERGRITVERFHFDGERDTAFVVYYEPQRLPRAVVDNLVFESARHFTGGPERPIPDEPDPRVERAYRRVLYVPEHYPPLTGLTSGPQGTGVDPVWRTLFLLGHAKQGGTPWREEQARGIRPSFVSG